MCQTVRSLEYALRWKICVEFRLRMMRSTDGMKNILNFVKELPQVKIKIKARKLKVP